MSDSLCYNCLKPGHRARDCRQQISSESNSERPVLNSRSNRNGDSFSYKEYGMKCFKCNKSGHLARYCSGNSERCYRCNKMGHLAKDCQNEVESGKCYKVEVFQKILLSKVYVKHLIKVHAIVVAKLVIVSAIASKHPLKHATIVKTVVILHVIVRPVPINKLTHHQTKMRDRSIA
jgi:hypothetical protein